MPDAGPEPCKSGSLLTEQSRQSPDYYSLSRHHLERHFFLLGVLFRMVKQVCLLFLYLLNHIPYQKPFEPAHHTTFSKNFVTRKDSDQTAHLRSLIRVFADRMCLLHLPDYSKKNKREPLPYCVYVQADLSLCWLHSTAGSFVFLFLKYNLVPTPFQTHAITTVKCSVVVYFC